MLSPRSLSDLSDRLFWAIVVSLSLITLAMCSGGAVRGQLPELKERFPDRGSGLPCGPIRTQMPHLGSAALLRFNVDLYMDSNARR
jgi:hypothetical protein